MNFSRLINKLNPRAPSATIENTNSWIDQWNTKYLGKGTQSRCASDEVICPGESRSIDFTSLKPVTDEDYLLEIDIAKNRNVQSNPKRLYSIPGGRVLGPEGYIVSPDNMVFSELFYKRKKDEPFSVFRRRRFPKLRSLPGTYISLVYPDSGNYFHWMLESLPNIKSIEEMLPSVDGIFVPELKQFHRDTLQAFGIGTDKLIELSDASYFSCERLLASSFSTAWALYSWIPGWLKSHLLKTNQANRAAKIYLTRRDSNWRRVTNEEEVIQLLETAGYQAIELSLFSCNEQARLFDSAISVISLHGAGLTNLAFCKPGTQVLEIFPRKWTSLCYMQLANLVGCKYHFMIATPLGQDRKEIAQDSKHIPSGNEQQGSDITIPIDKLIRYLGREGTSTDS